jgi:hypothetical protein
MTFINVGAPSVTITKSDADFYRFNSILKNDEITTPTTRQIGKYKVVGQNHKDGSLFETEGLVFFIMKKFEQVTEAGITFFITEFHNKKISLSCFGPGPKDKKKQWYDNLNDPITTPTTRQIGKYTAIGQNHKDGALFTVDGRKIFVPVAFDKVTESVITSLITQLSNKSEKDKADYEKRFEEGRKIIEEIGKQESEHVELVASALKKNPAIILAAFKKHPEILKEILSSTLQEILREELKDLRKELMASLHAKLPEIIRAMIQE